MSTPDASPRRPGDAVAAALAGVGCAVLTLGVAQLVAAAVSPRSAPVVAVAEQFIDLTPAWLKEFAIATFGTHDKLALLTGIAVVLTLVAAMAGVLARRRPAAGVAVVAALGAVAAACALARPASSSLAWLPTTLGTLAGAAALAWISGGWNLRAAGRLTPAPGSPATRRTVLTGALATAAAGAASGILGRSLAGGGTPPETVALPAPTTPAPAVDAGGTFDGLARAGMTPFVTPARDFYRIDTAITVPRVEAASWRLRVHGDVDHPFELTFDELLAEGLVERWVTLTCVSNQVGGDLAGNARWLGVPTARLLERARPRAGADMVLSTSSDGWTAGTPLTALTDDRQALVAVAMNGRPLPREHGFPARLVVPGLYGYVSATKWVVDLEVTRFADATGYWTTRGWSAKGPIRTASRIDVPRSFAKVRPGRVQVAGVAWAQHRGISAVQVRVDGGPWAGAELDSALPEPESRDTWRQWRWTWPDATRGDHRLEVRAVDGTGTLQDGTRRAPDPDGATGWHSVAVQVT